MLKKAAIIVAGSAAAILAAAPLALAHGYDHSPQCNAASRSSATPSRRPPRRLRAPGGCCWAWRPTSPHPSPPQAQAPIASCNNVENVLNTHIHDNVQDNSVTKINRSGNNNGG